jgi:Nif-specific regulatory protein
MEPIDKQAELAVEKLADKLPPILQICQKINSQRDLPALLDLIAREATRLLEADRASLFLLNRETNELWSKVALGSEEILRFDARLGIAGSVTRTGELVNVEDAQQDPRFYQDIDARTSYRTRSILAVPLRSLGGEIIGAFEVLNKHQGPFTEQDVEILKTLAAQAAVAIETAQMMSQLKQDRDQLLQENTRLWKEIEGKFSNKNILGTSAKLQNVLKLVDQISESSVNVLITGESGTGKELIAKAIHYSSPRARRALVALNCAALPDSLVESELFGIEKGVATGVEHRIGKFEAADGGTLFLDEIGDLSLPAQAKLLRVLQEGVIERVGGRKEIRVNVRTLAASNKDLEVEIKKGQFRQDLYYRLKVIQVRMPALREMREDIALLANHFVTRYSQEARKQPPTLAPAALTCLTNYSWPGNVRELENEMRRLVASVSRDVIGAGDLSDAMQSTHSQETPSKSYSGTDLKDAVIEVEKRMIADALERCRQNQQQAARDLGLSRQGLIKKMKRYGLFPTDRS